VSAHQRLVYVVGVGRSGTSLLAGILGQVGFHIPQPEVKADDTNPRGFGEPQWVVQFHRRLMGKRRVTVFDSRPAAWDATNEAATDDEIAGELRGWLAGELSNADAIVVKDPRISWFLPLWTRCAREVETPASFVTMLRHPAEILASAKRSYGGWQSDASRATSWLNVMLETERSTRGERRAFVRYGDLLADWAAQLRRAGEQADLPLLRDLDRTAFPSVDEFVDPSLYRARTGWDGLDVPASVRSLADEVWDLFQTLAVEGAEPATTHAALDDARERYLALYAEAEAIAQSSVTAVKPRKQVHAERRGGMAGATAKKPVKLRQRVARRLARAVRG
jgi:hypothetical protein